jgi:ABC-type transport system involved in cytochrome bd biosynthesis fused ATPase/permease subunit
LEAPRRTVSPFSSSSPSLSVLDAQSLYTPVPQNPWIQNATVRENILFGDEKPDEARFREAIRSCALESDVAMREIFSGQVSPLADTDVLVLLML